MSLTLEIRDLTKTYPSGVQALKGVTLSIGTGMFGLLGPNGAGKTTLMRTLATLQEPDSGSIRFGGLDVLRQKEELRQQLGYLPQEFGVYPRMSAEAMLLHFAALKGIAGAGERKTTVEALLRQTNLWDVRRRKLGTYSGGMRQRFGIAQALLGSPKLLIVDEPTAGLDPEERLRFHNLLAEIGENVVVLLSTHIVEDVSDLCRRMAVLAEGRVLLSGEPQAAIEGLRGRVFRKVVSRDEMAAIAVRHTVVHTRLQGGMNVVHVLAETPPGDGFEEARPSLEDVYFAALKGHFRGLAA